MFKCLTDKIDEEMGNFVEPVENRIQNSILTAIDYVVTPRIELAVRPINAFSRWDAANFIANSEHGERIGILTTYPERKTHFMI